MDEFMMNRQRCRLDCLFVWAQEIESCVRWGSRSPMRQFWWIGAPVVKYRHFLSWDVQKTAEPIDLLFALWTRVGRRMHTFNRIRQVAPISLDLCKMAEPIDLPFGLWSRVGRRKHKFNRVRQVAPMCLHWRTHCRHLANTIERGDAPYVKLLWPLVIFGHAHLDSLR